MERFYKYKFYFAQIRILSRISPSSRAVMVRVCFPEKISKAVPTTGSSIPTETVTREFPSIMNAPLLQAHKIERIATERNNTTIFHCIRFLIQRH